MAPRAPSLDTDEALAVAYASGEVRAFEELFTRYAPVLLRYFQRTFRADRAVAEDLTQKTFVRVHRAIASYDRTRPFRPWLFTIAARLRTDESRLARRHREQLDAEGEPERLAGATAEVRSDPRLDAVEQALATLTEEQRELLHLHQVEGLTYKEIGDILGISAGAAKLRAFRAYEILRELLGARSKP